ncbi:MAG TPA: phosphoenolpyruvate mutase [Aestuariivirgaceae bacterium]
MKKTTQFRRMLQSNRLEFLMEAHNGLSATIVEEAGFKGIWASGLSMSAALGVRDNNEASWTQVLEVVEFMSDATSIPILLDGDTGYGNFNNMRRLVRKLEQRGIAAVCIEDKLFPKTNSFIGEQQELADMDEFAGKIKAVKDAQVDPDFSVVARLEGFIAGWGLDEVLRRAHAYADAGADALLIHSKKTTPDQILAFAGAWRRSCPIIIVPTMYYSTPVEVFEQAGIGIVIWANHNIRIAISAMQSICRSIHAERSVANVEDQIASVKEIFRLQRADELAAAEERYLPKQDGPVRAIVLAASRGAELGELTTKKPKAMVQIGGRPLLHRQADLFRNAGVRHIVVVRGYGKNEVDAPDVRFVDNDEYADTGELYSLFKALGELKGEVVISFGDVLFRQFVLNTLLAEGGDIVLAVDAAWRERAVEDAYRDFVTASRPYSIKYDDSEVWLRKQSPTLPAERIDGEWIGLMYCSSRGAQLVADALHKLSDGANFRKLRFEALFEHLLSQNVSINVHYITGHWLDVDRLEDLSQAQTF